MLATCNAHKRKELGALLDGVELEPVPAGVELGPETGETFADNALAKARVAAAAAGAPSIADDSGIEAQVLGGAPGVRSARWAGEDASDEQNLARLLREVPAHSPLAYVCAIAYVDADGEAVFHGRCRGTRAPEPAGEGGFGYDPAFVPDDAPGRTMAQLSRAEKDAISHRGIAARELLAWLRTR